MPLFPIYREYYKKAQSNYNKLIEILQDLKNITNSHHNPNISNITNIFQYYLKLKIINIYKLIIYYEYVIKNLDDFDHDNVSFLLLLLFQLKI